jgi:large subunit ribosomal protein L18
MADRNKEKSARAAKRRLRVRGKIHGTAERPRLTVVKSLRHVYAQLVDDMTQATLIGISSGSREMADRFDEKDTKSERARKVGETLAEKALEKGITQAIFDRGRYRYHGRIKAVGEGARKKGLKF